MNFSNCFSSHESFWDAILSPCTFLLIAFYTNLCVSVIKYILLDTVSETNQVEKYLFISQVMFDLKVASFHLSQFVLEYLQCTWVSAESIAYTTFASATYVFMLLSLAVSFAESVVNLL